MKFRRNFTQLESKPEINGKPSKTIPDMTLSMRQLLDNHTRGVASAVKHYDGQYFEDQEIPIFDDLTDALEYRKEIDLQVKELEKRIKADKKAAAERKKPKDSPPSENPVPASDPPKNDSSDPPGLR